MQACTWAGKHWFWPGHSPVPRFGVSAPIPYEAFNQYHVRELRPILALLRLATRQDFTLQGTAAFERP